VNIIGGAFTLTLKVMEKIMSYGDARPSDIVSGSFGVEVVTLADNAGVGANQECREVTMWPESGKSIKIGHTAVAAASGPVLPSGGIVLAIDNTNKLYFGGTSADKVYLVWRS
jgi:hypothetical protein